MQGKIGEGKRVLLIEDEAFPREIYIDQLKSLGFDVEAVTTHSEIERRVLDIGKVDLILADNNVYGNGPIEGFELDRDAHLASVDWIQHFRSLPNNPNSSTPVILHTNTHVVEKRILQSLEVGIEGFLHKSGTSLTASPAQNLMLDVLSGRGKDGDGLIVTPLVHEQVSTRLDGYVKGEVLSREQADIIDSKVKPADKTLHYFAEKEKGTKPVISLSDVDYDRENTCVFQRLLDNGFVESAKDLIIEIQDVAAFVLLVRTMGELEGIEEKFSEEMAQELVEHLGSGAERDAITKFMTFFVDHEEHEKRDQLGSIIDECFWSLLQVSQEHPICVIRTSTLFKKVVSIVPETLDQILEAESLLCQNRGKTHSGIVLIEAFQDDPEGLRSDLEDEGLLVVARKIQESIDELLGITSMIEAGIEISLE